MNFYLHELSHLILSLLVGLVIWKISGNVYVLPVALMGGFFIDLDHFLDYFLAFGAEFNFTYFLKGYQFLKTDKIYILFHSWELVIFLLSVFVIRFFYFADLTDSTDLTVNFYILSFSLSFFLHLLVDVFINNMKAQSYFLYCRIKNNFELKALVTSAHYQKHLEKKSSINK